MKTIGLRTDTGMCRHQRLTFSMSLLYQRAIEYFMCGLGFLTTYRVVKRFSPLLLRLLQAS